MYGFDVDVLEIRMYDLFDVVDAHLILESTLTGSAIKK